MPAGCDQARRVTEERDRIWDVFHDLEGGDE
jgi:hypothetical protein